MERTFQDNSKEEKFKIEHEIEHKIEQVGKKIDSFSHREV